MGEISNEANELLGFPIVEVTTKPFEQGEIFFGDLSYYMFPISCVCNKPREIGEHWFCPAHNSWYLRGRINRKIKITNELAKDYGWV